MAQVLLSFHEQTATITLTHPDRLNALTVAMWQQLQGHFEALQAEASADRVRVVIIQGAEGNFAAGADISEFPTQRHDAQQVRHYHQQVIAPALWAIQQCPCPVVAKIRGACVGGGLEIASCCDLRLAAEDARFGVPIHRLGFPMAPDELRGLVQLAGPAVAAELLLEGAILNAQQAWQRGLVTRVVPEAELAQEVAQTVTRILSGGAAAARLSKQMLQRLTATAAPLSDTELTEFFEYAESAEHREGVRAFLEKRTPQFGE